MRAGILALVSASVFGLMVDAASRTPGGASEQGAAARLRIVIIEGEDAVNVIQQKTAVAPVVEVRDRNDQPVAGAVVRFAITRGRATFGGARTLTLTTNAAGRAAVTSLTPTGSGALQISASAAFQGQSAAVTIAQTNVMTAIEASSAGTAAGAGGGSGGGFPTGIVAGAGAGVGGLVVAQKAGLIGGEKAVSYGCSGLVGAPVGLVDVTVFTFTLACDEEGVPLTVSWDFGDGARATGDNVSHMYRSAGAFHVVATASNSQHTLPGSETTINIYTVTGQWRFASTGSLFNFVQSGNQVIGTYTISPPGSGTGTLSGTLQYPGPLPHLSATLSGPQAGRLDANINPDFNTMNAVLVGSSAPGSTLTRQ